MCFLQLHFQYFTFDVVAMTSDKAMIAKIVGSLGLTLPSVVTDAKTHLQSLFNQWLPLSQAVLGTDFCQFDGIFANY